MKPYQIAGQEFPNITGCEGCAECKMLATFVELLKRRDTEFAMTAVQKAQREIAEEYNLSEMDAVQLGGMCGNNAMAYLNEKDPDNAKAREIFAVDLMGAVAAEMKKKVLQ